LELFSLRKGRLSCRAAFSFVFSSQFSVLGQSEQQDVRLRILAGAKSPLVVEKTGNWEVRTEVMEPTIGLEPMTCRLRIDCSTN
jgi:hypothetical protein